MARTSEAVIRETQKTNVQLINEIFGLRSSFWGIDRIELTNCRIYAVDDAKLLAAKQKYKSKVSYTIAKDSYSKIKIIDGENNVLNYGLSNGFRYCWLSIVQPTPNIRTSSIQSLHQRVMRVLSRFTNEYGVTADTRNAIYKSIEISYTAMFDNRLPSRVRQIIMRTVADTKKEEVTFRKSKPGNKSEMDAQTIRVKNERAKKPYTEYILYDKTAELIQFRKLPKDYPHKIYRFEDKLLTTESIKEKLGSAGFLQVTDESIIKFLDKDLLPQMEIEYIKIFESSVQYARAAFDQVTSSARKTGWQKSTIYNLSTDEIEYGHPFILDEEAFLYSGRGGNNGSRTQRRIIEQCESIGSMRSGIERNPLCRMDGWAVEDFINEMLDATEYAQEHGLGIEPIPGNSLPKMEHLAYGDLPSKDEYFRYINAKSKPRYTYMQSLLYC